MSERVERLKTWGPVIVWALVIFGLSSIPGTQIPDVGFTFADKVAHMCVYGVLGALFFRAWRRDRAEAKALPIVAIAALCALAYGVTDEFHQMFVPNRSPDVMDLLADFAGGTAGAAAASRIFGRHKG